MKDDDEDPKPPKDVAGEEEGKTEEEEVENRGTLQMDATVASQDIKFPTDTRLLNECRLADGQKWYSIKSIILF